MRFAHLADTHLGYRQYNLDEREEDFYRAFNEAVDKILMHKCDFVVHSGDLFDEPRPHVRAMVEVRKALEKLHDNHIPFFAIPGNHDILMRRGAVIPHAIYRKMEILTDKNPWREHEGIFICGLQYHSRIHSGALRDRLKELGREAEKHEKRILLLHQGIERYIPLEYELKFSDIPNFDYYALGHVHKRILDGKLAYPGATEMWRMDEIEDYEKNGKGFYIVDTDNFSVEKVELEGIRPFMRFEVDASCDIEKIKKKIAGGRPVLNITVASEIHEYQQL
ncbi:MAG: exonuclease SbcCD subunit D, partial [Candidatus Hydrothermarchaeaceae archaeon]